MTQNKMRLLPVLLAWLLMLTGCKTGFAKGIDSSKVPGVVVDHSPASSGRFIGSPSLVIMTNGDYLASHDFFGPRSGCSRNGITVIFRSLDHGVTWQKVSRISGAFWSNLFVHNGSVYLMGVNREYGDIVIRRSDDDGKNWTVPVNESSGRLTASGHFHTAPVPVVECGGRLWRAFENAGDGKEWGKEFQAGMLSITDNADLLMATNWIFSNFIPRNPEWLAGNFNAWLEGNAVRTPDDRIVDVLRVDTPRFPERAAIVQISNDGRRATFSPTDGFVDLPGGAKKFTIRFDAQSGYYWSLSSVASTVKSSRSSPGSIRNTLALIRSRDLHQWDVRDVLLHDADMKRHGFQYADWQFDGDDIIAVVRTAFDDGEGGAHTYHDANFLTFHRWKNFRELSSNNDLKAALN
jgi:hypothetical protein